MMGQQIDIYVTLYTICTRREDEQVHICDGSSAAKIFAEWIRKSEPARDRRRTTFLRLMVLHYLICLSIEHALAFYSRNIQEQKFNVSDNLDDSFKNS